MLAERGMMSCEEVRVGSRETASMVEEAQVVVSSARNSTHTVYKQSWLYPCKQYINSSLALFINSG